MSEKEFIENEIYSICDEIEEENNKNIKKIKLNVSEDKVTFISKKISKIKRYINNSELSFELNSDKEGLKNKLNTILASENSINQILMDNSDNISEINEEIDSIISTIKEIEPRINYLLDPSLYMNRNGIKNNIQLYRRKLDDISSTIELLKTKAFSDFEDIKNNINEELQQLTNKQQKLDDDINNREKSFEQNISELQEIVDQKNIEIETMKENYNTELENIKKSYEEKISEFENNVKQDFDNIKAEIEKKDEKISGLIGLIGNKANIGEYKSNADKAHSERIRWQIATVIIFCIAFILIIVITFFTKDYNLVTLTRYIASIVLLGMAGYTGKQASNLRKDEVYYRKQQLELSSIDVYLDDMPDNIKQEIKQDLSKKIFGQAGESYKNTSYNNKMVNKALKILDSTINTVNKNSK